MAILFKEVVGPEKSRRRTIILVLASLGLIWFVAGSLYKRDQIYWTGDQLEIQEPWEDVDNSAVDGARKARKTSKDYLRPHKQVDTLIMYAYFETDNAFENAKFFISHGLHSNADFIFILQGEARRLLPKIPRKPNIRVVQRENTCQDMGSYGEVLRADPKLRLRYQKFILLNASIRGPFLPTWSDDCWSKIYTKRIDDDMKIQAMSAHCLFNKFQVQSMILATDSIGIEEMLDNETLDCVTAHNDAIAHEIEIANKFNQSGYSANAFNTALHGDPLLEHRHNCTEVPDTADPNWDNKYFGFNIHPYETIFVKANRNVNPIMVAKLTEWHDRMQYSSYDYC